MKFLWTMKAMDRHLCVGSCKCTFDTFCLSCYYDYLVVDRDRYACLDPEVGYCQGMAFIAALFLTYMPEDYAFYCFYATLNVSNRGVAIIHYDLII
jgi:hypothetical protein